MIEECLKLVEHQLKNEMSVDLQNKFMRTEVEEPLQQRAPLKSLGLDGYEACFINLFFGI